MKLENFFCSDQLYVKNIQDFLVNFCRRCRNWANIKSAPVRWKGTRQRHSSAAIFAEAIDKDCWVMAQLNFKLSCDALLPHFKIFHEWMILCACDKTLQGEGTLWAFCHVFIWFKTHRYSSLLTHSLALLWFASKPKIFLLVLKGHELFLIPYINKIKIYLVSLHFVRFFAFYKLLQVL